MHTRWPFFALAKNHYAVSMRFSRHFCLEIRMDIALNQTSAGSKNAVILSAAWNLRSREKRFLATLGMTARDGHSSRVTRH
jgi:hypothetical protein